MLIVQVPIVIQMGGNETEAIKTPKSILKPINKGVITMMVV